MLVCTTSKTFPPLLTFFLNFSRETFPVKWATQQWQLMRKATSCHVRVTPLFLFADWPEFFFSGQSEAGNSKASGIGLVRVSAQGLISILQ